MKTHKVQLVSVLHSQHIDLSRDSLLEGSSMASSLDSQAHDLPFDYTALVDPNDETIETEITKEMIELALEAVEREQVWPFCGATPMKASAPRRSADVIRFPGC